MIKWYNYYSFWTIIWFILYKQKIIKIQPSYSLILANIFILCQCFLFLFMNKNKLTSDNIKIYITIIGFAIIIDIIPFIFLMPLQLDLKTLAINLLVFVIYLLFMYKSLNYNVIDIINMYISLICNKQLNSITYMQWLNEKRSLFSF